MEVHTGNALAVWTVPQCPFSIEYVPRVLDDIRLTVMDAFFSLPRGGAEIGGILLGSHGQGRVTIVDFQALDCEHALGPGFTLSANDKARLTQLLAAPRSPGLEPVGWYHSHTRSEIFLSEADLEIHRAFFGAPWQVAMVMKPHTFQPPRVGFFFCAVDGSIQATASYREFQLQPLAIRQIPAGLPPRMETAPSDLPLTAPPSGKVITLTAEPVAEPAAAHQAVPEPVADPPASKPEPATAPQTAREPAPEPPAPEPEKIPEPAPAAALPSFLEAAPSTPFWRRRWVKAAAAIFTGIVIGSAAYLTRQAWLPPLLAGFERLHAPAKAAATSARPAPPATIALSVLDSDGQLQIHWDQNSPAVRGSSQGVLEIADSGSAPKTFPLDAAHLGSGAFTYIRQGEQVDVALSVVQPGGPPLRQTTTFVGKLPDKPEDVTQIRKQRDDLARQNLQLQSERNIAIDRARKLEQSIAALHAQMQKQQRTRLGNQIPK